MLKLLYINLNFNASLILVFFIANISKSDELALI